MEARRLFTEREILVAEVCPRYSPNIGGIETHVREISERLVKSGFNVDVLTTDPTGILPQTDSLNRVTIRRFKSWAPYEAYYFSRDLNKYLFEKAYSYSIVHAHSYAAFPALYAAKTKRRNKFVFTPHYHGTGDTRFRSLLHVPYKPIGKTIFNQADMVICVSNHEKELVKNQFNVPDEKLIVIPNGFNPSESVRVRERDRNLLLYVGRVEEYKGIHFLIEALPYLRKEIRLAIVGKGTYKPALMKLTKRLKVENRVQFYEDLSGDELLRKYAEAGAFVLLSKHEAYGITVAEALAAGTPCLVAYASALKEWVDGGYCYGINCPIRISELVDNINRLINNPTRPRTDLPTWDEVTGKVVQLFRSL